MGNDDDTTTQQRLQTLFTLNYIVRYGENPSEKIVQPQ